MISSSRAEHLRRCYPSISAAKVKLPTKVVRLEAIAASKVLVVDFINYLVSLLSSEVPRSAKLNTANYARDGLILRSTNTLHDENLCSATLPTETRTIRIHSFQLSNIPHCIARTTL
jgi:hypothetical protein